MWRTKTKANQVIYAGKPLEAGLPYSLIVRTNTGKSSQEDIAPNRQQKLNCLTQISTYTYVTVSNFIICS
ncbi:hypothetical protein [Nostoc sp.]|uniref:hypothetical protein n=1 Tax=Nostoc sp. TaxID=1180 RepID=UPI002FF826CA